MNFQLTEAQAALQEKIRDFAKTELAPIAAQLDATGRFPSEIVKKLADLGWMGLTFPKEYSGAGLDYVSYAVLIEELSHTCASVGTVVAAHTSLCSWPIFAFGTEEQKMRYLSPLAKGEFLGAFGLTEPNAGSDAAGQQTRAVDGGDCWILNGSKVFITNGGYSDVFVILAMTDKTKKTKGISAFIIEKNDPGFSIGKTEEKMGIHASSTTELIFQNCRIPKDRLLGKEGEGFKVAMATLEGGRIGVAAQGVGIAQGAFDITRDYMKNNEEDGKKIYTIQPMAFEMADLYTRIRCARLLVYEAASLKDQHLPMGLNSAMAKYYASEIAMAMAIKGIQFHGEYGYTKRAAIERYFRDAKITEIYEGTTEIQKVIISSSLFA